jgi:hypothetical protein
MPPFADTTVSAFVAGLVKERVLAALLFRVHLLPTRRYRTDVLGGEHPRLFAAVVGGEGLDCIADLERGYCSETDWSKRLSMWRMFYWD